MAVKEKHSCPDFKPKYPYAGQSRTTGVIVLFVSQSIGPVIHIPEDSPSQHKVGDIVKCWDEGAFIPVDVEITTDWE